MPSNRRDQELLALLLSFGAKVPRVTKWGARYYFKHYDIAEFLLEKGMDANHMNCHHTTLLHEMGFTGDVRKAKLLIDHGAEINVLDEEFRSTPLGFAARWGKQEVLELLLESGAEPNLAGAEWATPLAWARRKGHLKIEAMLKSAGARGG
jgi:ankyrin repeat protein